MTHVRPNLRLYLANRTGVLLTPVVILTIMLGLSLIVAGFIGIATGSCCPRAPWCGCATTVAPSIACPGSFSPWACSR